MKKVPNPDQINAVTGLVTAISALVAIVARAIEKAVAKRRQRKKIIAVDVEMSEAKKENP